MRKIIFLFLVAVLFIPAVPALAASPEGEHYINQIVGGGYASLRRASQGIFKNEITEKRVLDVLSEKVLQSYNVNNNTGADAVSWACKALGKSGKLRYKNVLQTVAADSDNAKIRKYAKQSLKQMPSGDAKKPYVAGSVDLEKLRKKLEKGNSAASSSGKKKGNGRSLSVVQKGMSLDEVASVAGEPTSTTTHVTGKSFNPYYRGGDNTRLTYFYKGRGRVFFSRGSKYGSRRWRVIEVELDPSEPGYP